MARRKMITIFLDPGKIVSESDEVITLKNLGWIIDLIIPQGKNEEGLLVLEVYLTWSERGF